jgi:hypothetical protein
MAQGILVSPGLDHGRHLGHNAVAAVPMRKTRHRLVQYMRTTDDDLAANRSGNLSPAQAGALRRDYRFVMAGALTGTPILPLFAYVGFSATERPVLLVMMVFVELAIILALYWVAVRPVVQVIAKGRVDTLSGAASWRRGSLYVGGQRVPVVRGSKPPILDGQICRAYVVPKGRIRLMALEPVDSQ